jgi:flagellar hook-associated protein 3 FlgL
MSGYRITPEMVSSATLGNINSDLSALERSSNELSSGKTILEPSDNPYGTSRVIDLQSQLDGLNAYTANAQDGINWQTTASGAMTNMANVAQRVRELLLQASSGTENQSDREYIATEVAQLTETVKQDANTQYGGEYVFSGTLTTTQPYQQGESDTYAGNNEGVSRAVGPGASIGVSTDISSVLGNGAASKDGKLLDTLRTITAHLQGGTKEDVEALNSTDLKSLDANIEALTELQAKSGSAIDQFQTTIISIEGLQASITATLSSTEDTNIATASIAFSNQQAAYSAALRAGASIVQESLLNFLK